MQHAIFNLHDDDENMFLEIVEQAGCDIDSMVKIIKSKGDITDDLSFVKISFQEDRVGMGPLFESSLSDSAPILTTDSRNIDGGMSRSDAHQRVGL
jgi:hypothetical protein